MVIVSFLTDTTLTINNTLEYAYQETYSKGDIEHVDLIEETESHIYVQFENGETSSIPKGKVICTTRATH